MRKKEYLRDQPATVLNKIPSPASHRMFKSVQKTTREEKKMFPSITHISSIFLHPESLLFPTLTADMLLTITILLLHLQENKRLELSHDICRHEPHQPSLAALPFKTINFHCSECHLLDTKAIKMSSPTTGKE